MVTILGSATTGYSHQGQPDLPRPSTGIRPAHRPWCVECKRKDRPLDDQQRCEQCARAVIARARAAERRAAAEREAAREQAEVRAAARRAAAGERPSAVKREESPRAEQDQSAQNRAAENRRVIARRKAEGRRVERVRAAKARPATIQEAASKPAPTPRRTAAARPSAPPTARPTAGPRRFGPPRLALPATEVIQAYRAGQTLAQIAKQHGCSHPTIARLLDEHGIARRGAPVPRSPELIAEIKRLYLEEGLTQAQVADRIGHSVKVVQNVMTELNLEARPSASARSKEGIGHPIKIPTEAHQVIVERYRAGESAPAIARTYGVAPASIYHVLNRAGISERHANRTLAGPGVDRAAPLRARMEELGVTSRDVKEWAHRHGLVDRVTRGLPGRALIEAYAAARHTAGARSAS